jgi:hypothetical protein
MKLQEQQDHKTSGARRAITIRMKKPPGESTT